VPDEPSSILAGSRQSVLVAPPAYQDDFLQIAIFYLPALPPVAKIISSKQQQELMHSFPAAHSAELRLDFIDLSCPSGRLPTC
jgi:hypothetical protein